jgi:EpsI family protein
MDTPGRIGPKWVWILLCVGILAAFWPNLIEMWHRWFPAWDRYDWSLYDRLISGESYYTHGPLVPLVSLLIAVLIIRHTRIRPRPSRVAGPLLLMAFLSLHLVSVLARVNFSSCFALVGVIGAMVLTLWGWTALRRLWFPVALLLFMVPLPEVMIADVNFRLKMLAADWGVSLAQVLGILAERSGNRVFLAGDKSLVVANVCNGLRTLISLLAFGALYAYVCRLNGLWRWLIFALSVPVALVSNSVRIAALVIVADVWSTEVATGAFHDYSGLGIYVIAFLLMFGIEKAILGGRKLLRVPADVRPLFDGVRRTADDDDQGRRLYRAAGQRTGLIALGMILLTIGGTYWLNHSTPPVWNESVVADAVPTRIDINGLPHRGYSLKIDRQALAILETEDYFYRRYSAPGQPPLDLCVVFSRDNRKGTHPPDLCLEGSGQEVVAKRDIQVEDIDGVGEITCREIVVQKGLERHYFLYVYRCGTTYTSSFFNQQWIIFINGLTRRDASGALIRVSSPVLTSLESTRRRSLALFRASLPHLHRALDTP